MLRYILVILGTLIFVNLVVVPFLEPGMLYEPPSYDIKRTPKAIGLDYEDLYLPTADGEKINGWFVPAKGANKVFLVFHGNASNLGDQLDWIMLYHVIGANVLMIDYRGYGRSEGKPSEQNLYMDADAAYDYLVKQKKYSASQIIVLGNSLGGAVAIDLASRRKVGGLAVRSTFTSLKDLALGFNPFYRWPIIWFRSKYDSVSKISRARCPTVIFHSIEDEKMPFEMAVELYKKAALPKKIFLLERSEHDYYYPDVEFVNGLRWLMDPRP